MSISFLMKCFKSQSQEIKYSELKEVEYGQYIYPILQCTYRSKNIQISKSNECNIKINMDSIEFKGDTIKFEYISHFTKMANRSIGITMFTKINNEFKMIKKDSLSIIVVKFTSNNARQIFMNTILKQIKLYKSYDKYDKSVHNFNTFKKMKR